MKLCQILWVLLAVVHVCSLRAEPVADFLSGTSEPSFGGYYLNVDQAMSGLNLSRLQAHEVQNQLRDNLEQLSGSFSQISQRPHLQAAFDSALTAVRAGRSEGQYVQPEFGQGEFVVVLDLDETLLSQWYESAREGRGTFAVEAGQEDVVLATVDRSTGTTVDHPQLLISGRQVSIRPWVQEFLDTVSQLEGFKGFIVFTAKEDKAAWAVREAWIRSNPTIENRFLGFYTRNYLKFEEGFRKPSKDLRLFDESLEHVVLIDDNESRVIQKDLNYRIPKYNADTYYAASSPFSSSVSSALSLSSLVQHDVLRHTAHLLSRCAGVAEYASCVEMNLGRLSRPESGEHGELKQYLIFDSLVDWVVRLKLFEPAFFIDAKRPLTEPFPRFERGRMLD